MVRSGLVEKLGEGYLNNDVATLPEILSDNGYFTAMSGKVKDVLLMGPVYSKRPVTYLR